jgi:hypothetical protein
LTPSQAKEIARELLIKIGLVNSKWKSQKLISLGLEELQNMYA